MPYKDKKLRPSRGLCVDCPNPVIPGRTKCLKHYYRDSRYGRTRRIEDEDWARHERERALAVREKRKTEGKCIRCGAPLDISEGETYHCAACKAKKYLASMGCYCEPVGTYKGV